jgi:hypothetical protein
MRWNELIGTGGDVLAVLEDRELRRSASGMDLMPLADGPGGMRRWLVVEDLEEDAEGDED